MVEKKADLLNDLFEMRDQWRDRMSSSKKLVKEQDLGWEVNRQGKLKWYLHPSLTDRAIRSILVFKQEIPPLSRSGKQKHQGGIVYHILEGRGYSIINGERHEWEAGDCVFLPILPNGVEYQHFNSDPETPAVFIAAEENLFDALGVDMGSGFEQLEDAPDYEPEKC